MKTIISILLLSLMPSLSAARGTRDTGGAFQYNNSRPLLADVSENLAKEIETMNPRIFEKLPKDLGQKEMAQIIRKIRFQPKTEKSRKNPEGELEPLMFDFGKDKNGYFLVAYKGYFDAYQAVPYIIMKEHLAADIKPNAMFYDQLKDVRRRLVHEFSHLLGKNEQQAKEFSQLFEKAANTDQVLCQSDAVEISSGNEGLKENVATIIYDRRALVGVTMLHGPEETDKLAILEKIKKRGVDPENCYSNPRTNSTFCTSFSDGIGQGFCSVPPSYDRFSFSMYMLKDTRVDLLPMANSLQYRKDQRSLQSLLPDSPWFFEWESGATQLPGGIRIENFAKARFNMVHTDGHCKISRIKIRVTCTESYQALQ